MQTDVERCGHDGIEALPEHAVAVRANHIMADTHALCTVDALVGIAQDEAMRQVHIIIMIVRRLTVMEAVIRQAMLDTVLLQVTLPGCLWATDPSIMG